MPLFRSIVFASVLIGLIVGAAVSVVQFLGTSQLILKAEVYEKAGEQGAGVATAGHDHDHGTAAHAHEEGGWEPADGFERNAFTLAANILTAIGYALVLTGVMAIRGKPVGWHEGLLWGLAGFACVMLAPMLGLPPELPGTPAAPLADRQLWWIGTASATAAGLALLAFVRAPWAPFAAIALIAAPHLIGAPPPPEGQHALAPELLQHEFVATVVLTSLIFWLLLGALSGPVMRRFEVE
jgi:cobalt transporter subunit CbtA